MYIQVEKQILLKPCSKMLIIIKFERFIYNNLGPNGAHFDVCQTLMYKVVWITCPVIIPHYIIILNFGGNTLHIFDFFLHLSRLLGMAEAQIPLCAARSLCIWGKIMA